MTREEMFDNLRKYFALSDNEIGLAIANLKNRKESRLEQLGLYKVLTTVFPYFDKFVEKTDEKLKRKVGKMLLSKVNYAQMLEKESQYDLVNRLHNLFYQTSSLGVNTYKIMYVSVLTDGNMVRDKDDGTKYFDNTRDFENIYKSLRSTLGLSAKETVEIFEKCSTLISKGYAYKFPHVKNKLLSLGIYNEYGGSSVFSDEEVKEILKINPSLFVMSTDRIQEAFDYLQVKLKDVFKEEYLALPDEERRDFPFFHFKLIETRKLLKNNSSLLTLNPYAMYSKEKFLKNLDKSRGDERYFNTFAGYFKDPINLYILGQIPYDKITKNASTNLTSLDVFLNGDSETATKYLQMNPYVVGMNSTDFRVLLAELVQLNKDQPEQKYSEKFIKFGKTLFASNLDFKVKDIIDKLVHNNVMQDIIVDELTERECLHRFIEIFMDEKYQYEIEIETLLKNKQERIARGETELRRKIRKVGEDIRNLPSILKDENQKHRQTILTLAKNIDELNDERFVVDGLNFHGLEAKLMERKESERIEEIFNDFRQAYELKHFKEGKKFSNVELLFEKTMNYLSRVFDDKEALTDLFKKEIVSSYREGIKSSFEIAEPKMMPLFGEAYDVKNVGKLQSSLKKLDASVNSLDFNEDYFQFNFEK